MSRMTLRLCTRYARLHSQCRMMIVMLNHTIDGNVIERMKNTHAELEQLIIDIEDYLRRDF